MLLRIGTLDFLNTCTHVRTRTMCNFSTSNVLSQMTVDNPIFPRPSCEVLKRRAFPQLPERTPGLAQAQELHRGGSVSFKIAGFSFWCPSFLLLFFSSANLRTRRLDKTSPSHAGGANRYSSSSSPLLVESMFHPPAPPGLHTYDDDHEFPQFLCYTTRSVCAQTSLKIFYALPVSCTRR
jgi:hypothetical protein